MNQISVCVLNYIFGKLQNNDERFVLYVLAYNLFWQNSKSWISFVLWNHNWNTVLSMLRIFPRTYRNCKPLISSSPWILTALHLSNTFLHRHKILLNCLFQWIRLILLLMLCWNLNISIGSVFNKLNSVRNLFDYLVYCSVQYEREIFYILTLTQFFLQVLYLKWI